MMVSSGLVLGDLRYWIGWDDRPSDRMLRKTEMHRRCIECWRAAIDVLLGALRYKNRRIDRSVWAWGEPESQRYWSEPCLVTSGLAMEHSDLTVGTISRRPQKVCSLPQAVVDGGYARMIFLYRSINVTGLIGYR